MNKLLVNIFLFFLLAGFPEVAAQDTVLVDEEVFAEDILTSREEDFAKLFDEKSRLPQLKEHQLPDSRVDAVRKNDAFWYANETPAREAPGTPFWRKDVFRTLLWIMMIGAFIAIVVLFLGTSNISLFRERQVSLDDDKPGDMIPENIFEINFGHEIRKAIEAGNYNLAVRLYYLQALKLLDEKEYIRYSQEKTNSAYLFQLYRFPFYRDFFRLTRNFEYVWYGRFPVTETVFRSLENEFQLFNQRFQN